MHHLPFVRRTSPGILPLVTVDRASGKPLDRQLYEGYRGRHRHAAPGCRPADAFHENAGSGSRRLPAFLVLNAFEQLLAWEGHFESQWRGRGHLRRRRTSPKTSPSRKDPTLRITRTRRRQDAVAPGHAPHGGGAGPGQANPGLFRAGEPPIDLFPLRLRSRLVNRRLRGPCHTARLRPAHGPSAFREAVAAYLRTGAPAPRYPPEHGRHGAQHALELTALPLLDPGESAWLEEPGYPGADKARRLGGRADCAGAGRRRRIDSGRGCARAGEAHAAYVTPSHQFPLGVPMSPLCRLQLLDG